MGNVIAGMILAGLALCICGCQETVTKEKHETIVTEEVVSEEIVVE